MTPTAKQHRSALSTSVERHGTHIRILIAVDADTPPGTLDIHSVADNLALHLTRVVVLIAPTTGDLDHHTTRLQSAAANCGWQLVPADGMHHRLLDTITAQHTPVAPCA